MPMNYAINLDYFLQKLVKNWSHHSPFRGVFFSFKGGGGGDTLLALLLFSRIHVMSVPQPRACMLKEKDY